MQSEAKLMEVLKQEVESESEEKKANKSPEQVGLSE